jgi:hypothetical protein
VSAAGASAGRQHDHVSDEALRNCGAVKPLDEYPRKSDTRDGYALRCKLCAKEYQEEHREQRAEYCRRYYQEKGEEIEERRRRYREDHREQARQAWHRYYREHRAEIAERRRRRRAEQRALSYDHA